MARMLGIRSGPMFSSIGVYSLNLRVSFYGVGQTSSKDCLKFLYDMTSVTQSQLRFLFFTTINKF